MKTRYRTCIWGLFYSSLVTLLCPLSAFTATDLQAKGAETKQFRRLAVADYRDKMAAGWIGQMAGVGWGAPTEFKYNGRIVPQDDVPPWKPELINQFAQDDIYVEMTFLKTLASYGLDVSIRQAGIDFANSRYPLWHANLAGRDNLRRGIAPPDSGHPQFNSHADDIDYQIEADYAGLISPGMPNLAIELGEKFGRLMNYGDGLYGGQFVSGMYCEAFFDRDIEKIVRAGLKCIPSQSQYAQTIRDVLAWHAENPDDWPVCWKKIDDKYRLHPQYRRFSCTNHQENAFDIDAKINGAYVVMGLLYGKGNLDQTIVISMRCGQDSDCNPSNAAGILAASLGRKNIPERFISALDVKTKFSHTDYNFGSLLDVCEQLTRQAVVLCGGHIESSADGSEVLFIPLDEANPGAVRQCWNPTPAVEARFSESEMLQINGK